MYVLSFTSRNKSEMLSCQGFNFSICFSQEEMLFWMESGSFRFLTSWQTLWVLTCVSFWTATFVCTLADYDPCKAFFLHKNSISVGFQSWMPRVWSCRLLRCIGWNPVLTSSPTRARALTFLSPSWTGEQSPTHTSVIITAASACAIFMVIIFYCRINIQGLTRRTDKDL